MTHMYSATGKRIPLELSTDDVAVLFDESKVAQSATRSLRAATAPRRSAPETGAARLGAIARDVPKRFGPIVLMHQSGAADAPIRAVARSLTRSHAVRAQRSFPVYIEVESNLRAIATLEISVRFKPNATQATQQKLLQSLGLKVVRGNEFHKHSYIVAQATQPDEWKTLELANRLSESADVEYAAPNFVSEHRKLFQPNDPMLASQWHLANAGDNGAVAGEDVGALLAWNVTKGGSRDIVIAIVDDGVDIRHPDLKKNIWTNPTAGAKDKHGRNFFDADFPNDPSPRHFKAPYDEMAGNDIHGTCCAGVAAAVGNNKKGVAGIAYNCRILPVKIFGGDDLATDENVANAIRYAGLHADVISCSWGGVQNPDLESAVADVAANGRRGKGALIFCATGNEYKNTIGYPARYPGAFGVGASNDQGKRSKYSNYGPGIEFVAPSNDPDRDRQGIVTTDVSKKNRGFKLNSAYTDDFGGTSSATPLAAGIGALVLSVKPGLGRLDVRDILRSTADKIDPAGAAYASGFSPQYGHGRLNAAKAVAKAATAVPKARKKTTKHGEKTTAAARYVKRKGATGRGRRAQRRR
jgi:subtilisin family serine protease